MTFPILGGNGAVAGYSIDNSLRFNDNDSPYLSRTTGTATNTRIFTYSVWVKRGNLGDMNLFNGDDGSDGNNNFDAFYFRADHKIFLYGYAGGDRISIVTNRLFRDTSAWYHLVLSCDTTQSTANDRIKLYVNGVQETSFSPHTQPSQNLETYFNGNSIRQQIGRYPDSNVLHYDGYMAEINFVDGQQLTPTSFGEFDEDSGIWKPIEYTGTYGNNGFYLDFENSGSLGADQSGNGNNFTPTNLASTDQTTDTPTNNFATFNPLARNNGNTYTEGNTVYDYSNNYQKAGIGSQTFSSGKWYAEFKRNGSQMPHYGIAGDTYHSDGNTVTDTSGSWNNDIKGHTGTVVLQIDGTGTRNIWADGSDTGTDTDFYAGTGDIIMIAFDSDTGKIWFGKNGTWSSSGNPATGSNPTYTYSGSATKDFTFAVSTENNSSISANFGNPSFSISSGNSDGNGYGNFEYAPPSGYLALCTQNLATALSPTIDDGSQYFNTITWSGDGSSTRSLTGVGFQPDWTWHKVRSTSASHMLYDSTRGVGKRLHSDQNVAEATETNSGTITSFDSDGFSVDTGASNNFYTNESGRTYVAWNWKANGGTTSSNTDGSITSTVQANTTAGFSIVTYTGNGNGSDQTVGHGLGKECKVVFAKMRTDAGDSWRVFHESVSQSAGGNLFLNGTSGLDTGDPARIKSTNTSTFTLLAYTSGYNAVNGSGKNYVAYCFADIEGYSKMGSYTGNANADGTFVYTGFKPSWIMAKNSTAGGVGYHWYIWDNKRDTFNVADNTLHADQSNAENTFDQDIDFLSNGFKLRGSGVGVNGGTMIYMAFAENPFVSSSGVPVVAR